MRPSKRNINQIRSVSIKTNIIKNAEGSCNIKCGNTEIICTATIDENVPHFMRKTGLGWVTAEYGMLPRSTNSRMKRESSRGKQGGRTLEIQRLIGRSLRTCVDRLLLGERQRRGKTNFINRISKFITFRPTIFWYCCPPATNTLVSNKSSCLRNFTHKIRSGG